MEFLVRSFIFFGNMVFFLKIMSSQALVATQEAEIRRIIVQGQLGQIAQEALKRAQKKRDGGVAQVIEHLLSNCKVLSSSPSILKKKKHKTQKNHI
jgi:type IV secretory pathway TrbF-like protein